MHMSTNRRLLLIYGIVGLLMIVLGAALFVLQLPSQKIAQQESQGIGGAFSLLDGEGHSVTEAVFGDKPRALMFGFTHCPDICPAGLSRMRTWLAALDDDGMHLRFAFITVDPERDTPPILARYVGYFSDEILPLSGGRDEIAAMLKAYGVHAQKVPLDGGGYTMDHHSSIFLFDGGGRFVEFIYTDDSQAIAMKKLRALIDS